MASKAKRYYRTDPSLPLYASDWCGSPTIQSMNPAQELAFIRLLMMAWQMCDEDCSLPDDPILLAQWSRMGELWQTHGGLVRNQFIPHAKIPNRIINKRLYFLWRERLSFRKSKQRAGKAGAEKRWHNDGAAMLLPMAKDSSPSPSPSPSTTSTEKERLTPASPLKSGNGTGAGPHHESALLEIFRDYLEKWRGSPVLMIDGLDLGMFAELSKIEKPIYNLEASIKFCHAKGWSPANIGKIMRGKIDPLKEPDFVKKPADIPSSRLPLNR